MAELQPRPQLWTGNVGHRVPDACDAGAGHAGPNDEPRAGPPVVLRPGHRRPGPRPLAGRGSGKLGGVRLRTHAVHLDIDADPCRRQGPSGPAHDLLELPQLELLPRRLRPDAPRPWLPSGLRLRWTAP